MRTIVSNTLYDMSFSPGHRKEKGASLPVPVRDAADPVHAELHLVGPVILRHLPVLLAEQGAPGAALGPAQGQPQDHDLPEDGAGAAELLAHRGDLQGEEETHLPVQREDAPRPAGRLALGVGGAGREAEISMCGGREEIMVKGPVTPSTITVTVS